VSRGLRCLIDNYPLDSETWEYGNVVPNLRKYVPLSILQKSGTANTCLANKDNRFHPRFNEGGRTNTEITRPAVSIEKLKYWEPTFFPTNSYRPWLPLIHDTDTHSWNLKESLLMLIAKCAILQRVSVENLILNLSLICFQSMVLCSDSELPSSLKSIRHFRSCRPGYPYHTLVVCVGALMIYDPKYPGAVPSISGPCRLKFGGKLIAFFFAGCCERVSNCFKIRKKIFIFYRFRPKKLVNKESPTLSIWKL
jgi:hypothetical protein